jgi:mono/diheme cytochrome c family protein
MAQCIRFRLSGVAFFLLAGGAGTLAVYSCAFAQGGQAGQRGNPTAAKIENGKKMFSNQKCEGCHGSQGQGGAGTIAGPRIAAPGMELAMFVERVRNPKDPMPAYSSRQVSDAALSDIYAFLKSIASPEQVTMPASANADNGRRLFTSAGCYECHGREAQGGANTGPRLGPNPIAFAAFVHQCRQPSEQMPPYTSKVLSDVELADIYAFLLSIAKPPDVSSVPLLQ